MFMEFYSAPLFSVLDVLLIPSRCNQLLSRKLALPVPPKFVKIRIPTSGGQNASKKKLSTMETQKVLLMFLADRYLIRAGISKRANKVRILHFYVVVD